MITMIDLCVAAQKRVIDVHEQSLQAARKTLDSAQAAVDMQKAMNEAASANANAWQNWLSLWGWRK